MRSYYCPDASAVKIDDAPKTKDEALKAPPIVFNAAEVEKVLAKIRDVCGQLSAVMEDMEQLRDGLCRRVKLPWESVASEEHKTALDHWDFVTRVTDMYRREYVIKDGILRDVTVCTPSDVLMTYGVIWKTQPYIDQGVMEAFKRYNEVEDLS